MTPEERAEKRKQLRAKIAAREEASRTPEERALELLRQETTDLIPELPFETNSGYRDEALAEIIDSIDIVRAYETWAGKGKVQPYGNKRESIMISCPWPGHTDKHPSAWINLDSGPGGLFHCAACERGGDKFTIAANHYGFSQPLAGGDFVKLLERMAGHFGYAKHESGGATWWEQREQNSPAYAGERPSEVADDNIGLVSEAGNNAECVDGTGDYNQVQPDGVDAEAPVEAEEESEESFTWEGKPPSENFVMPPAWLRAKLDWRALAEPGTFLYEWMLECCKTDATEEFHFWYGLVALGLAVGRDAYLEDGIDPVYGNLFVCALGSSTDRKSRTQRILKRAMRDLFSYTTDPDNNGVNQLNGMASGEAIIAQFSKTGVDPYDNKTIPLPVKGLIIYDEFQGLTSRQARPGSTLRGILQDFYGEDIVGTATKKERFEAYKPFCSMISTTQPEDLKNLIQESDLHSGFLNRWVFAIGPSKQRQAIGSAKLDLARAYKCLEEIHTWSGSGRKITWSDSAAEKFTEFFDTQITPAQENDQSRLLLREDLTLKKVMLLLAVNNKWVKIDDSLTNKLPLLHEYLVESYGISAAAINETVESDLHGKILRYLTQDSRVKTEGMTAREFTRKFSGSKTTKDQLLKALKIMTETGEISIVTTPSGRTQKYFIVE